MAANLITIIGATTAFFAATVGLAQNDIKRVVAYSTCSQLGYMFFAAGVGAYKAAMFHLFTHAFFKALLFLSAGSVIHGLHHEQDMRNMGGVRKPMPLTWAMMLIGTLALIGVGIPGVEGSLGFAGFYSKDAIIESAYASHDTYAQFAFWLSIGAALLTTFYSWRLMFMTFEGKTRADHHTYDHAHDPPVSDGCAADPAGGRRGRGWRRCSTMPSSTTIEAEFWGSAIFNGPENHVLHDRHDRTLVPLWVVLAPAGAWITGLFFAVVFYLLAPSVPRKMAANGGPMHSFLYHKWYFDEIYNFIFVKGAALLGDLFWKVGDKKIIDGLGPDGVTSVAKAGAGGLSRLQTGYLFHYALVDAARGRRLRCFRSSRAGALTMDGLPILSLTTFLPLAGALLILGFRVVAGAELCRRRRQRRGADRHARDPRRIARRAVAVRRVAAGLPAPREHPVVRRLGLQAGRRRHGDLADRADDRADAALHPAVDEVDREAGRRLHDRSSWCSRR